MMLDRKSGFAICAACGGALLAAQPHPECRPAIELCAPRAIHQPDLPHQDHSPGGPGTITLTAPSTGTATDTGAGLGSPPDPR